MNQNPPEPSQRINIDDSSIEGQVGQAGRDLRQFQFIFRKRKSNPHLDRQNCQVLLDKVKNFWVNVVLERLSDNRPLSTFDLEERLDLLEQSWGMVYEMPNQLRQSLPSTSRIIDLFDELGEGGTLLILGEPSSGKTRILLELARDLITRAEINVESPLPVIFHLSSWKGGNQTFADWLIQELQKRYRISKAVSKTFVKDEYLLLLLDGLDEVHAHYRDACVNTLNQFIQKHGKTEIILCSRIKEYEALPKRLRFQRAIYIKLKNT